MPCPPSKPSMDELAMDYVIAMNGDEWDQKVLAWNIYQEMLGRCGDHAQTYLDRAREVYRMVCPLQE